MKQTQKQKQAGQRDTTRKQPGKDEVGNGAQQEQGGAKQVQGEGNVEAARRYNEQTREFAESGEVEHAAREAAPGDAAEAKELDEAERAGRARAREEDPAVDRGRSRRDSGERK